MDLLEGGGGVFQMNWQLGPSRPRQQRGVRQRMDIVRLPAFTRDLSRAPLRIWNISGEAIVHHKV